MLPLLAKMHGAANDFVVVPSAVPADAAELVRALADRRRGIGADGVLFIERIESEDLPAIRMHFYNRDGSRAGLVFTRQELAKAWVASLRFAGWARVTHEIIAMETRPSVVDCAEIAGWQHIVVDIGRLDPLGRRRVPAVLSVSELRADLQDGVDERM